MTNLQQRNDAHLCVLLTCVIGSSISLVQASTSPIVNVSLPIAPTAAASAAPAGIATPAPIASVTPAPSATPPVDPIRSEIKVGDAFLAEHEFSDANQAYLRALKSADATTRQQALEGIKRSLSSKDFRSWVAFYWNHPWRLAASILKTPLMTGVFFIIIMWVIWVLAGQVGNWRGRNAIDVVALTAPEQTFVADRFRLALRIASEELRASAGRVSTPVVLTSDPLSLVVADRGSGGFAESLSVAVDNPVVKIFAFMAGRLFRAKYIVTIDWSAVDDSIAARPDANRGVVTAALARPRNLYSHWQRPLEICSVHEMIPLARRVIVSVQDLKGKISS
jgi:hypothetical protein